MTTKHTALTRSRGFPADWQYVGSSDRYKYGLWIVPCGPDLPGKFHVVEGEFGEAILTRVGPLRAAQAAATDLLHGRRPDPRFSHYRQ